VPFFVVKQGWAIFLHGFSGLLPRFSANQNYWSCACNPCIPTSNSAAFHNSIIGIFMVCQDRLEKYLLQLFHFQKIWNDFYHFCYYFWGQHCCWIETNIIGNDFYVSIALNCFIAHPSQQNRRQKVFNRGAFRLFWGLDILKFSKNSTDF